MQTTLILSQIVLNFSVFVVIMILGGFSIAVLYQIVRMTRALETIVENVSHISEDILDQVHEIIGRFSAIPLLSLFLRKRKKTQDENL